MLQVYNLYLRHRSSFEANTIDRGAQVMTTGGAMSDLFIAIMRYLKQEENKEQVQ